MSVSNFHCPEPVELIILKKPELNPTFSSLKANFATPDKKQQLFYCNFYKDTVIIILDIAAKHKRN